MNIFKRNRSENWIIKLFKITDSQSAELFDMENCILTTIDSITQRTDLPATDFDINYKNSNKTLNGFKKALKNQKEIVYNFVGFDSDKTNTYFTISNPMLNYTEKPKTSKIDICIQISSDFLNQKSIEQIAEQLIDGYEFEYGFITKLPANYDSFTERKMKKGPFSTGVEVNEIHHAWTFHSVGIREGFIKRLYSFNYLNSSHFANADFEYLVLNHGIVEKLTSDITKWTLNTEQLDRLKNNKIINEISIITPRLEFLKTDKAKAFNDKMKI